MPCHHNLEEYLTGYLGVGCAAIPSGRCSARSAAALAS
jgi:hypothetical protein